jgi:hypothetical protein
MPPPSVLFLRLTNEIRGPFGRDRLRELAQTGVITPATEAAESAAGPWLKIEAMEGWTEILPERPQFRFKAKQFLLVNQPAAPPVDHRELIAAANPECRATPAAASPRPLNEVVDILRQNREREQQAGLDRLKPMPPAKNRRRRDCWILLVGGNLIIFLGINAIAGPIIAAMLVGFFTAGITWIMYGVMDRY